VTATPPSSLASFRGLYPFPLDPFQEQACRSLDLGNDVLVAAPTGAGKTVVGEYAVHRAVQTGRKCFYTTPIKALSNQKYADLRERYGEVDVGLLTGDVSVNGEAPVVVMTTEVLRNMLYAGSATLQGLGYVVMDEVHYLADKERGPVWEEVIITLPPSVSLVSLSATVSNAEEFGEWLGTVRGPTDVVVEEHRPVPLWQHVMVGRRLHDLFIDEQQQRVNPELVRLARESARLGKTGDRRPERGGRRPRVGPAHLIPSRADVVDRLERADLLPVIVFIFSRAGCDAAAEQALRSGLRLTDTAEAAEIDRVVERRSSGLAAEDRAVLGFEQWRATLLRGVAAHHAGLLPIFKQVVEELFARGLVKVVYATETLALGINMPARSVVLERLVKWNGEQHVDVTPGEYTQLTGRAGRRGIDVEGHGVVLWHQGLDPVALGGLASTRTYPLRSSFRPSYNMAVNLVHQVGRDRARRILESSFAQFQTDRATVGLASRRRRLAEAMAGYADAMTCDRGDFGEYATLRRELSDVEAAAARERRRYRQEETAAVVTALRVGDILDIPSGRSRGLAVVLQPAEGNGRDLAPPVVLSESRQVRRLSVAELRRPRPSSAPSGCPARSTPRCRGAPVTRRADARGGPPTRARHGRRPIATDPRWDRRAGPAAAGDPARSPLPRVPGPGRARPLGRAEVGTAAGVRPHRAQRRAAQHVDRQRLRPGLPGARRAGLPRRRHRHRRRGPPARPVRRARPAGGREPASGAVGRPGAGRAGRVRIRPHLPGPWRRARRCAARAARTGAGRARADAGGVGRPARPGGPVPPVVPATTGPRLRPRRLPLGSRPGAGGRARRGRSDTGGLRPRRPPGARRARPGGSGRRVRSRAHRGSRRAPTP
jgi:ATP-dependent RNA helicase HelY